MSSAILSLSDRGQVTIPQEIREKFAVKHFFCVVESDNIVLKPLQTREEFVEELEKAEKDWKKNGGLSLSQIKIKYNIK